MTWATRIELYTGTTSTPNRIHREKTRKQNETARHTYRENKKDNNGSRTNKTNNNRLWIGTNRTRTRNMKYIFIDYKGGQ